MGKQDKCEKYPSIYKTLTGISRHRVRCTKAWLYCCDKCASTFMTQDALHQHQTTMHSEARPYRGGKCAATFKFRSELNYHKHSEFKPFKCDRCAFAFKWKYGLKLHQKHDHAKKQCNDVEHLKKSSELQYQTSDNRVEEGRLPSSTAGQELTQTDLEEDKPVAVFRIKIEEAED